MIITVTIFDQHEVPIEVSAEVLENPHYRASRFGSYHDDEDRYYIASELEAYDEDDQPALLTDEQENQAQIKLLEAYEGEAEFMD